MMGNPYSIYDAPFRKDHTELKQDRCFDIPSGYGDNKIVLMVRDPWTLYAYWEIKKEVEDKTKEEIHQEGLTIAKSILRIYEIIDPDRAPDHQIIFDFELKNWANSWYVHANHPGKKWKADIGILCATGRFFPLAGSNIVETPSCGMSNIYDEEWMSGGITSSMFGSANLFPRRK